eukprot:2082495-Prymnesium_polylepis.1
MTIARPHNGLATVCASSLVRPLVCTLVSRLSGHACPSSSARPAGDTRCGGCSAAGQLGVAV